MMLPSVNLALQLFRTKFKFMNVTSTVMKTLSVNAPSPVSMGCIGVNLKLGLKWYKGGGGGSSPQRNILGNEVAVANPIILPSR